jgi:hypothetical protein
VEIFSALATVVDQFYTHTAYCVSQPTTAAECGDFWSAGIFGCFALGSLALLFLVWKSTSYSVQFYAAQLMPLEWESGPAETPTNNLQWVGDAAAWSETAGDELEDRIRAALRQIALAESAIPAQNEVLGKAA